MSTIMTFKICTNVHFWPVTTCQSPSSRPYIRGLNIALVNVDSVVYVRSLLLEVTQDNFLEHLYVLTMLLPGAGRPVFLLVSNAGVGIVETGPSSPNERP